MAILPWYVSITNHPKKLPKKEGTEAMVDGWCLASQLDPWVYPSTYVSWHIFSTPWKINMEPEVMMVWKMFLLFQGARILRFHVNLARCIFLTGWVGTTHHRKDKVFGHIFPKETHMTNKRIHARWSWRSILSWLILNKCLPIFLFQIRPRKTNGWTPTDPPKVVGKQRNDSKPTIIFSVFCHSFSWV